MLSEGAGYLEVLSFFSSFLSILSAFAGRGKGSEKGQGTGALSAGVPRW
jgi:hypothetical protein